MPTIFNKGLRLEDYALYIAMGKSLEQLENYDQDIQNMHEKVTEFVESHGAQKAQISVGAAQKDISGLVFVDEIPLGWKQFLHTSCKPDHRMKTATRAAFDMANLRWNDPHHYLGAYVEKAPDGSNLFVLAAKVDDSWIIAAPKGKERSHFVPQDAVKLNSIDYKMFMGYDYGQKPLSPSEEEAFTDHPLLQSYPFEVKEEHAEKYGALRAAFWAADMDSQQNIIPQKEPTMRDYVADRLPLLKKLGL